MKKLVEIRDLTFGYAERPILEHIHMDIYERDYVLVLGPNGGGKTTLLKLMMGILQPWKGSYTHSCGCRRMSWICSSIF